MTVYIPQVWHAAPILPQLVQSLYTCTTWCKRYKTRTVRSRKADELGRNGTRVMFIDPLLKCSALLHASVYPHPLFLSCLYIDRKLSWEDTKVYSIFIQHLVQWISSLS